MAAPDPSPIRSNERSREDKRRLRHEGIERRKRWLANRDAFLEAALERQSCCSATIPGLVSTTTLSHTDVPLMDDGVRLP